MRDRHGPRKRLPTPPRASPTSVLLKHAKFLINAGLAPMAREPLRQIIREAPGTPIAREASRRSTPSETSSRQAAFSDPSPGIDAANGAVSNRKSQAGMPHR